MPAFRHQAARCIQHHARGAHVRGPPPGSITHHSAVGQFKVIALDAQVGPHRRGPIRGAARRVAELAKRVVAPGPQRAVALDRQAVPVAAGDGRDAAQTSRLVPTTTPTAGRVGSVADLLILMNLIEQP